MLGLNSEFQPISFGLLGFAAGTVLYSIFVYNRRVRLLVTGQPYGYIDHFGPILVSLVLFMAIICVIVFISKNDNLDAPSASIKADNVLCIQHELTGVSLLEYQPSDILPLHDNERIMVASLETVTLQGAKGGVETLASISGADLEGLTSAGSFVYALSETSKKTRSELIELEWVADQLEFRRRWEISTPRAEGIAYIPGSPGSLYIAGDRLEEVGADLSARGTIEIYDIPDATAVPDPENPLFGRRVNANLINEGLIDSKISALQFFEHVLYILHDNDGLVRAWDLNGKFLSEWKLPAGSKQWEGMALERRQRPVSEHDPGLRRRQLVSAAGQAEHESVLLLHLAMDTPPQVWTFTVQEGKALGEIVFPDCANA
jgi:hypothetical protein